VQLVTPVAIIRASPHRSSDLRRFRHPSDKRANPHASGAIGDPPRSPRTLAARVPVEICSVTLPATPDAKAGLAGVNAHEASDGLVVQPIVNVPCEPPNVVSTSA
jgi:hypothetical protein